MMQCTYDVLVTEDWKERYYSRYQLSLKPGPGFEPCFDRHAGRFFPTGTTPYPNFIEMTVHVAEDDEGPVFG